MHAHRYDSSKSSVLLRRSSVRCDDEHASVVLLSMRPFHTACTTALNQLQHSVSFPQGTDLFRLLV